MTPEPPPGARKRHSIPPERWPSAIQAARSQLFSPLVLPSGLRLDQRTWVPAMVPWRASDEGFVTPDVLQWYERFARGRPGVLVVEATGIRDVPSGPLLRIGDDRFDPGLCELVQVVEAASEGHTRLFIQLIDFLTVRRRPSAERFFGNYLQLTAAHRKAVAVRHPDVDAQDDRSVRLALAGWDEAQLLEVLSEREWADLRMGYRERVTDTHLPHVAALPETLPGLFADAAVRARRAGFDGVELHYAHAYTMAGFLSLLNGRGDGYGATPAGRLRLPLEVYQRVRRAVGADYPVGCRMLSDEVIEGGSRLPDACGYAVAFASAGMDFLSISRGGKFEDARQPKEGQAVYPYTGPSGQACMPTVFASEPPFARNLAQVSTIRRAVRAAGHVTPVVAAGGFNAFGLCEAALRDGHADLIAAARQSLADPDWWIKMLTGRGDEIVRCLYTNYCEALDQQHRQVTCQLWDRLPGDSPRSADGRRRLVAPQGPWKPPRRP